MGDPFARFGGLIVRLRWAVLIIWLVLLATFGVLFAPKAAKALKGGGYSDPNSQSAKAAMALDQQFGASDARTVAVVFRSTSQTAEDPSFKAAVTGAADRLAHVGHVRSVASFYSSGNPLLLSDDHHLTLVNVTLDGDDSTMQATVPALRDAVKGVPLEHYVTGVPALNKDIEVTSDQDLQRAELFTIPIVVILLVLVFRTIVAAAMPLVVGAASVVVAVTVLYGIALQTDLSIFALNVASMIGLGLGIDFSLIMVTRFREQLAAGLRPADAAVVTVMTAGRSITYSGVTVLLGMFVLTALFNLTVVRSISLAVMVVAATALLAGLTLLPAVLAIIGHRVEWLRVIPRAKPPQPGQVGFWYRFSHAVMRHPAVWLAASLIILVVIASPARELKLVGITPKGLPGGAESVKGANAINGAFGGDRLAPMEVVIRTDQNGVWKPEFLSALQALSDRAAADPRNQQVISLTTIAQAAGLPPAQIQSLTPERVRATPGGSQFAPLVVNLNGDNSTALVTIFSKYDQLDNRHEDFVLDLRHKIIPSIRQLGVYNVLVGGNVASSIDFRNALYQRFPYLVLGVMVVTFIMLMMFFQSVFLPLKAILLNLVSIVATYGVLVALFQYAWGEKVLGFTPVHKLGEFTPAIVFAILFGLSTDYEVFMLSRVKEYYHKLGNNEEAVAAGLEQTAGMITAAGLILIGTFGSFGVSRTLVIKEIGIGLAIGVLIDSTIVRVIMVPATMRLMGHWNWWMPSWLKRIVPEIREAPLPAFAAAAPAPVLGSQPSSAGSYAATAAPTLGTWR
ncbi:MAG TPA: MMPL family transporter, partial [Chloroflexota bacterium]